MATFISILRGINVSGKNLIKMEALRKLFVDAGFSNVQTYIQSGNVIFETKKIATADLEKIVSGEIKKQFGLNVPVLVITLEELKNVIKNNPFANDKTKDTNFLHVTFLSGIAAKENIAKISAAGFLPDEFFVVDKAGYLYCPNGYGNTKL
ncbi:MAG: DUF1697 domain-containing protein, partial [Chitinophagaceae bacterium]|nr:DUF1697 domain-containing protein [Chitinophagaceae bacterium]